MIDNMISSDLIPINLPYAFNTKGLLTLLRGAYPDVHARLVAYHKQVVIDLKAYVGIVDMMPVYNMGSCSAHYEQQYLQSGSTFLYPNKILHFCNFLHPHGVGIKRFMETAGIISKLLTHISGRSVVDRYVEDFVARNGDVLDAMEKIYAAYRFGGKYGADPVACGKLTDADLKEKMILKIMHAQPEKTLEEVQKMLEGYGPQASGGRNCGLCLYTYLQLYHLHVYLSVCMSFYLPVCVSMPISPYL
jgi:hypothetical protein